MQNFEFTDVHVKDELYETLDESQILFLINSLKIKKEIPHKYSFIGQGAQCWDEAYKQQSRSITYGTSEEQELLDITINSLSKYIANYDAVNVIDIGSGNFAPAYPTVLRMEKANKLNKYICIDISKSIIEITKSKFCLDFPIEKFESHILDIEINSIQNDLFANQKDPKCINIFLLLGGTIGNIENQVQFHNHIYNGMNPDDILIVANRFDDINGRNIFPSFQSTEGKGKILLIAKMLNLETEMYSEELIYNSENGYREFNIIFNQDINIHFDKNDVSIYIKKGESINICRHKRDTFESIVQKMKEAEMNLLMIFKQPITSQIIYVVKSL